MLKIHLICVGKFSSTALLQAEQEYRKRISRWQLLIHEVKGQELLALEEQEVLKKIGKIGAEPTRSILLAEKGQAFTDGQQFCHFIEKLELHSAPIVFVIGGASGHGPALYAQAKTMISLSPLTFPHQLARLIFVEQLYRAQTIIDRHPYHK